MRKIPPKKISDICMEWDNICNSRQMIIESGKDISLTHVTAPCILNKISQIAPKHVLDIGCGTGYITSLIAKQVESCYGVDVSKKSIAVAQSKYYSKNLHFFNIALSDFRPTIQFDACVSNMVFTSDPDWISSLNQIYNLLVPGGHLLIMITHPCFWPEYWGFNHETWYNYEDEIFIEHDFSISLAKSIGKTTYIHRPLSNYIKGILSSGFAIEEIVEPYPSKNTPHNYVYDYPRFLFFNCKRNS